MLALWLFALVSGWANACVLQEAAATRGMARAVAKYAVLAHGAGDPAAGLAGHEAPGGHDADGARAVCQSVCDDEQSTLPKVSTPSIPDLGAAPLVPAEAWSFCAAEAQFPSGCPLAAAPPPEPPVAIRFLRLTI